MHNPKVSAVVPTVGRPSLVETVRRLNCGTHVPDEILVCVAKGSSVPELTEKNIRVLHTGVRGQVAQRAIGFRNAANEYVLQLDDDILLDERCIEILLKGLIGLGPDAAIGPRFTTSVSADPYNISGRHALLTWVYGWLMNGSEGYTPGGLLKAGICSPQPDPLLQGKSTSKTEWLPGGCILHHRKNLVLDDFFPFTGKAYCEDLMHSHLLRSRGVTLYVCAETACYYEYEPPYGARIAEWFKYLQGDYRARSHVVKLIAGSRPRMLLYYALQTLKYIALRCSALFFSRSEESRAVR